MDIVLFDLDGVLVRPGGYRAAVRGCMGYLIGRLGVDVPVPGDEVQEMFEARGVTSEWDMVPYLLGTLLSAAARKLGEALPALDLPGTLDWLRGRSPGRLEVNFLAAVDALKAIYRPGDYPADVFLAAAARGDYPPLAGLQGWPGMSELFVREREVKAALTTQLVQNFVLGSRIFQKTYQLPAPVEAESTLEQLDRANLTSELAERIRLDWQEQRLHLCAFTARPSLPPRGSGAAAADYSPEAEMALEVAGLPGIPLMGYGRLIWLGRREGEIPDRYLKPAPVQPLAAIYAAWGGSEAAGLDWALRLVNGEAAPLPEGFPRAFRLHVFEDSSIGLLGAKSAADRLARLGLPVELHRWGIAVEPEKIAALQAAGAERIFADVNEAVTAALYPHGAAGGTEARSPRSLDLDRLNGREIAALMNREDASVVAAVETQLEAIGEAIETISARMQRGGRLVYIGAGTSGRVAAMDASEIGPTFSLPPGQVLALMAGGPEALAYPVEDREDDEAGGQAAVAALDFNAADTLIGIAASGRTPFVLGGMREARRRGGYIISLACNHPSALAGLADTVIAPLTGPEVLTGSTRLKAGTAQKMVLNMISTGVMVRLGKTYSNLMVDLQPSNEKLRLRARRIVAEACGLDPERAAQLLEAAGGEVKTALVMHLDGVEAAEARRRLAQSGGRVRPVAGPAE